MFPALATLPQASEKDSGGQPAESWCGLGNTCSVLLGVPPFTAPPSAPDLQLTAVVGGPRGGAPRHLSHRVVRQCLTPNEAAWLQGQIGGQLPGETGSLLLVATGDSPQRQSRVQGGHREHSTAETL